MPMLTVETLPNYIGESQSTPLNTVRLKFIRLDDHVFVEAVTYGHLDLWALSGFRQYPQDAGRLGISSRSGVISVYESSLSLDIKEVDATRMQTVVVVQALVRSLAEPYCAYRVVRT